MSWFWRSRPPQMIAAPSSPASMYRPTLPRLLLKRLKYYIKRINPICLSILGVLFIYLVKFVIDIELGPRGSFKGGHIGIMWDQYDRYCTRYKTILKWREEVKSELQIPIVYKAKEGAFLEPWFWPLESQGLFKTRPNYPVVEMLLRERRRVQKLDSMIQYANAILENCARDQSALVEIPPTVLQLLPHHEQQALPPYWIVRSESTDFDSVVIRNSDSNPSLAIKSCQALLASNQDISTDTYLQCVAHHLGGMQLSNSFAIQQTRPFINDIFSLMGSLKTDKLHNKVGGGTCNSRVGYAVFSNVPTPDDQLRKTSAISSHVSTIFAAFPPDHPGSLCIPSLDHTIGVSPYNEANEELSFQSTFANKLLTEIESRGFNSTSSVWGVATLPCDFTQSAESTMQNCCNQVSVTILDSIDTEEIAKHLMNGRVHPNNNKQNHHLIFTSSKLRPSTDKKEISNAQSKNMLSVMISEVSSNSKPTRRKKESIQMKLRNKWRCEPGWFCNRCLQSSIHGSFSSCASTCGKCAANAICDEDDTESHHVKINAQVTGLHYLPTTTSMHTANTARHNRIPRIIHQTYFEEITMEKYPQLLRLQNTWRASGWEYKFYTDDTARQFIGTNYPPRFVSVFDSLLPGAYKADFFRYLVLFKEGGIYVDVDVILNTNLDSFITPDLAFFAPLDAVGIFADEQFCVWNGLLGSAPAHPALANVIEWMVNLVSNRGDVYDMERTVCRHSGVDKTENWKVRMEPGLMLSGPCALGLALNNALGNEPLSKFSPGLLTWKGYNEKKIRGLNSDAIGNVMILLADKNDLGAFRFSDPERNMIVASTDLSGLSKAPMIYESSLNLRSRSTIKQRPHYSISTHGEQLWGTHDVYADDFVEEEVVSLVVSYK